jgi:hypothetical protein
MTFRRQRILTVFVFAMQEELTDFMVKGLQLQNQKVHGVLTVREL